MTKQRIIKKIFDVADGLKKNGYKLKDAITKDFEAQGFDKGDAQTLIFYITADPTISPHELVKNIWITFNPKIIKLE